MELWQTHVRLPPGCLCHLVYAHGNADEFAWVNYFNLFVKVLTRCWYANCQRPNWPATSQSHWQTCRSSATSYVQTPTRLQLVPNKITSKKKVGKMKMWWFYISLIWRFHIMGWDGIKMIAPSQAISSHTNSHLGQAWGRGWRRRHRSDRHRAAASPGDVENGRNPTKKTEENRLKPWENI
jgi:hypothetical protein